MQLLRRRQGNVRRRAGLAANRMKLAHADVDRARGSRRPAFASRAFDGGCWVLAIALLGVYCGLRSSSELDRRAAIAVFFRSIGAPITSELSPVGPTDLQAPDSQH
jgi:hypothetical protein